METPAQLAKWPSGQDDRPAGSEKENTMEPHGK
jgi:hypothetical protein